MNNKELNELIKSSVEDLEFIYDKGKEFDRMWRIENYELIIKEIIVKSNKSNMEGGI